MKTSLESKAGQRLGYAARVEFPSYVRPFEAILIANNQTLSAIAVSVAKDVMKGDDLHHDTENPALEEEEIKVMKAAREEGGEGGEVSLILESEPLLITNAVNCKEPLGITGDEIRDKIVVITPHVCTLKDQVVYLSRFNPKAILIIHSERNSAILVSLSRSILEDDLSSADLPPVVAFKASQTLFESRNFPHLLRDIHHSHIRDVKIIIKEKDFENDIVWINNTFDVANTKQNQHHTAAFLRDISER